MEQATRDPIETDVVVIGAGPAGLFAAFQLGLLGLSCRIVDTLARPGGQCVELYGDKLIYDIPGLPRVSGVALINRLLEQIAPFDPIFHLGQTVTTLACPTRPGEHFALGTSAGLNLRPRAVIIAAGVGAFEPRPLQAQGAQALGSPDLLFDPEHPALSIPARSVLIVGGGEEAAMAALELIRRRGPGSQPVKLLHRRNVLSASPEILEHLNAPESAQAMNLIVGVLESVGARDGGGLTVRIDRLDEAAIAEQIDVDHVLVCQGRSPRLGPIRDWGLELIRKQLPVDPASLSTSHPGLFAIGDIASYPGKKKLIVSAFHEATLAAYAIATLLDPAGQEPPLLYTSSSSELQRRLNREDGKKSSANT
jgi:thioredoxin reductase (NADPH)